jgi:hypothetical protein
MSTYTVFEEFTKEAIAPSMYHWMAERAQVTGCSPAEAVDAYFGLSRYERFDLHVAMLRVLERDEDRERELHEEELFFVT